MVTRPAPRAAGRPAWAGLAVALAIVAHGAAAAGQTRALGDVQSVWTHSAVVVSALPAPDAGGPPRVRIQPRRFPDPARLSSVKTRASSIGPSSAAEVPAPSPDVTPPSVVTAFEGPTNADNAALTGFSVLPSDATLAVGPAHVFEAINLVGRITDKAGGAPTTFTLRSFFSIDDSFDETDPRVLFDGASQRWFVTMLLFSLDAHQSAIVLAVSATADPRGAFCRFRLGNPALETFIADFPQPGIDDQKVIVTFNAFDFSDHFLGAGYYALDKAGLVQAAASGCGAQSVAMVRVPPDAGRYGIYPAQSLSSTGRLYMAMNGDGVSDSTQLTVLAVDGRPGVTTLTETAVTLPIRVWSVPPNAVQAGSNVKLVTNDSSVITATWRRGSLWVGGNEGCQPGGDSPTSSRSCVRVIEVQTDLMTVQQDITLAAAGQYFFYPALAPDGAGNLALVFNASSANDFAGIRLSGRRVTDPPNTLAPPTLLRAGGGAQIDFTGRMGDYHGATPDPADAGKVWVVAGYIRATAGRNWGTYVAAVAFPPLPPPALALVPSANTYHPGDQLVVNLSVTSPSPLVIDVYFGVALPPDVSFGLGCPAGDAAAFADGAPSNLVVRCLSQSPASFPRLAASVTIPGGLPASLAPGTFPPGSPGIFVVFMAFTAPGALLHGTLEPADVLALAGASVFFSP